MGYEVDRMIIISIQKYDQFVINKPNNLEIDIFKELVEKVRFFNPLYYLDRINKCSNKCNKCIYRELCNNDYLC